MFGELALFENGVRTADVVAATPVRCFMLTREAFAALQRREAPVEPARGPVAMPDDWDAFQSWIAADPDVPGSQWDARRVLPAQCRCRELLCLWLDCFAALAKTGWVVIGQERPSLRSSLRAQRGNRVTQGRLERQAGAWTACT